MIRQMRLGRLAGAALASASLLSAAHAAEAIHVRGTITAVEGPAVTIKTNDDTMVRLTLGDGWKIGGVARASLADVKQGTFIGTANVEDANGNKALEVVVFPEALRGTGEGNYGWDLKPKSAMTNATVQSLVQGVDGQTVTLAYKGGEKKVSISPGTPIVTIVPATADDVKPGAKVFAAGIPNADATMLTGGRLVVGKDGTTPPM